MAKGNATIGALRVELGLDSAKFTRGARQVKAEASGLAGTLSKTLGAGALVAGGLIGSAAATMVASLRPVAQAMDDLAAAADRIGLSAESLQAFRHAAETMDVPFQQADAALERLNASLGAIHSGVGASRAQRAFSAIGFTKEQLMRIRDVEALLPELADRISALGTKAERVQVAKKLGVEELLPLVERGSAGLAAMEKEARDLGLVLDENLVQNMAGLNEELRRADESFKVAGQAIVASLAPALKEGKRLLAGFMADWASSMSLITGAGHVGLSEHIQARVDLDAARQKLATLQDTRRTQSLARRDGAEVRFAVTQQDIASAAADVARLEQRYADAIKKRDEALKPPKPTGGGYDGGGAPSGPSAAELQGRFANTFWDNEEKRLKGLEDELRSAFDNAFSKFVKEREARKEEWGRLLGNWMERGEQGHDAQVVWEREERRLAELAARVREETRENFAGGLEGALYAMADGDGVEYFWAMFKAAGIRNLAAMGADWLMGQQGSGGVGGFLAGMANIIWPKFEHGGSMTVRGKAGIDNNFVGLWASQGEQIDVRRAGDRQDGAGVAVFVDASPYFDVRVDRIADGRASQRAGEMRRVVAADRQRSAFQAVG